MDEWWKKALYDTGYDMFYREIFLYYEDIIDQNNEELL